MRPLWLVLLTAACAAPAHPRQQAPRPVVLAFAGHPVLTVSERIALGQAVARTARAHDGVPTLAEDQTQGHDAWGPGDGACVDLPGLPDPRVEVRYTCGNHWCELGATLIEGGQPRWRLARQADRETLVASASQLEPAPLRPEPQAEPTPHEQRHELDLALEGGTPGLTADDRARLDELDLGACVDGRDWALPTAILVELDAGGRIARCRSEEPWGPPARGVACVCQGLGELLFSTGAAGRTLRLVSHQRSDDTVSVLPARSGVDEVALAACFQGRGPRNQVPVTWSLGADGSVAQVAVDWGRAEAQPDELPAARPCAERVLGLARFACPSLGASAPREVRGTFGFR